MNLETDPRLNLSWAMSHFQHSRRLYGSDKTVHLLWWQHVLMSMASFGGGYAVIGIAEVTIACLIESAHLAIRFFALCS